MSNLDQKILISGCGLSWSGQERKVWTNILKIAGINIIDVGGPAVSNRWVVDQAFFGLLNDNTITDAVVQLTSIGKLDIEVDSKRELELVKLDSIRNFTHQGVWPSSGSQEHPSKQLWYEYLYSPRLETQELFCKIMMLENWCETHDIKLTVLQGYEIPWTDTQLRHLKNKIYNLDKSLWSKYEESIYYTGHDHNDPNTVPGLGFQFDLAIELTRVVAPTRIDKINYIKAQYDQSSHS